MKKLVSVSILVVTLLALMSHGASAQTREAVLNEITLRGTVEAVDHSARTVRIRGPQGNVVTLDVPTSVVRFDRVQVGDTVTIAYYDRVALRSKPAGEAAVDTVADLTTPSPGALPAGTRATQRITTVTITGWDPATRIVTYTGPRGQSYSRYVAETVDPAIVAGLKAGDRVDVVWTEALRLSVQSGTPAAVAQPDSFRHRLTAAVQWGVDNQFSGKMIKAATGQTVQGAPIDLNETSYDEVYGRMGLFKIGVGYRTSPRSEAVLNFVISRSGADTANLGTVGAARVPLYVNFDDYNYWGFEGGQRFYFARVRFTPYLGYLFGVNRFDDIRGQFVDVPLSLTPGLAAQDGKFFEKSWALSFGPTAGVLVGLGPIELMAEVQYRYMGGLSDVDWLVEEGLRDINSGSSRWSIPILIGARMRF